MNYLKIIQREVLADERGFFHEVFRKDSLEQLIEKPFNIVQQNHSRSVKGTLRGIHVAPWGKLLYVTRGIIQSVVVDCRKFSKTYGEWTSTILDDRGGRAIYIPPNCGNSFLILSDEADVTYLVDDYWSKDKEYGIIWNDETLKIAWANNNPLLSEKDKNNKPLKYEK